MKKSIFFLICVLSFCAGFGQNFPIIPQCRIEYEYDNAGNRVKRFYHCESINDPIEHMNPPLAGHLYPNPTSDVFDIDFQELLASAHITVLDIYGRVLGTADITDGYVVSYSLGSNAPGTYAVTLAGRRPDSEEELTQSFTVVKLE